MENDIIIKEESICSTIVEFLKILKCVSKENIRKVKIYIDTNQILLDFNCPKEKYPIMFTTKSDKRIYIQNIPIRYNGQGTEGLLKILRLAGFYDINPNNILINETIIDLSFEKSNKY